MELVVAYNHLLGGEDRTKTCDSLNLEGNAQQHMSPAFNGLFDRQLLALLARVSRFTCFKIARQINNGSMAMSRVLHQNRSNPQLASVRNNHRVLSLFIIRLHHWCGCQDCFDIRKSSALILPPPKRGIFLEKVKEKVSPRTEIANGFAIIGCCVDERANLTDILGL
eukprot:CAMPEP_0184303360 /NCGR_PEP_ID=MMETSP1049-20130417/13115_1 /TAXON_ID=77928 /ORGANISM="Proteomonas sulcata, Strain CCMP704" /LENGTH=166 /DNA_ID=CAMNT_0026614873 /DNA_START=276 /DNA_END=772 /DNA_ORIENTATION=-